MAVGCGAGAGLSPLGVVVGAGAVVGACDDEFRVEAIASAALPDSGFAAAISAGGGVSCAAADWPWSEGKECAVLTSSGRSDRAEFGGGAIGLDATGLSAGGLPNGIEPFHNRWLCRANHAADPRSAQSSIPPKTPRTNDDPRAGVSGSKWVIQGMAFGCWGSPEINEGCGRVEAGFGELSERGWAAGTPTGGRAEGGTQTDRALGTAAACAGVACEGVETSGIGWLVPPPLRRELTDLNDSGVFEAFAQSRI